MIGNMKFKKEVGKKKHKPDKVERKMEETGRLLNRKGLDGKILTCHGCGSEYQFLEECDIQEATLHVKMVKW